MIHWIRRAGGAKGCAGALLAAALFLEYRALVMPIHGFSPNLAMTILAALRRLVVIFEILNITQCFELGR